MMRAIAALAATLCLIATGPAAAQAWPTKQIRIVVAFPAGGSTDIATRPVADRMAQALGQSIVIENRTGAGGNIGADLVAKSPPDGYTILSSADALASNPHLYTNLGFDVLKDLAPVVQLARQPVLLAVHPSLGVSSLKELIAAAKAKPGLAYATSGAGSQQHMVAEMFAAMAGIQLTHVPYRGGGQAITDLVGGHTPIGSLGSSPLIPHYKAGQISCWRSRPGRAPRPCRRFRPITSRASTASTSSSGSASSCRPARRATWSPGSTRRRCRPSSEPAIRERYAGVALEPVGGTPEQLDALLREDHAKYAKLIRELKIKLD